MKNIFTWIVVAAIIGVGAYFIFRQNPSPAANTPADTTATTTGTSPIVKATSTAQVAKSETVIGKSVNGNNITAYHFGTGSTEVLFVGGLHGGYEWNTALVAYQLMDYLKANPSVIPKNVRVTVIPVVNPDGLKKVTGTTGVFLATDVSSSDAIVVSGRFNANNVDLNRNFDCDWQAKGVWQTKTVSGGTSAFSEPESAAIKKYVDGNKPSAVIVWYSAGGGVFASSCHNGVSAQTNTLTKTYAQASGYKAYQSFDFYATTGDMVNWLAKNNIPAISVLLTDHTSTEWSKNQAGVNAVLKYYGNN